MTIVTLIEKLQEDISWLGYNATEREIIEHIKRAITLLKEQEAVEPERNLLSLTDWFCGKCGRCISRFHDYCPSCGKAVKWE